VTTPSQDSPAVQPGQAESQTEGRGHCRQGLTLNGRTGGAILAVLVLAVYWPVCTFDFVGFDDPTHITENPNLHPVNAAHIREIWAQPYVGLYIPAAYTAWAGIQAVADKITPSRQGEPNGEVFFHSANLLLHLLNALLVFALLARLVPCPGAAMAGALLFALHPLQAESVAWISEFRGLLSAAFGLCAFLLYSRRPTAGLAPHAISATATGRLLLALLCYTLALLSKPSAVALPLGFLMADLWLHQTRPRQALPRALPFFLLAALFTLLTRGTQPETDIRFVTPLLARPLIAADALGFYLLKLLLPVPLTIDYGRTPAAILLSDSRCALAFAELAALMVGAIALTRHAWGLAVTARQSTGNNGSRGRSPSRPDPEPETIEDERHAAATLVRETGSREPAEPPPPTCTGAWLAVLGLFLAGLLPVLGLIPFVHQAISTTADRYTYLALLGPALGAALLVTAARCRSAEPETAGTSRALHWIGLVVLATLVGLTALQLQNWRDSERLYRHALAVNPASSRFHNNLGQWYIEQHRFDDARHEVRTCLELDPFNRHACQNLGVALINTGQPRRARACLDILVRESPGVAGLRNLLGVASQASGNVAEAETEFRAALRLNPSHRDATLNLANLLLDRGQPRDALALVDRTLERQTHDAELLLASARALGMLEQWDEAAQRYAAAADLAPDNPLPRYNLANTLLRLGRAESALEQYREALRLNPTWFECRANMAVALEALGRFDDACAEYVEVRRLNPSLAANSFYREGMARRNQGNPAAAAELLRKALDTDPNFAPARNALAELPSTPPANAPEK